MADIEDAANTFWGTYGEDYAPGTLCFGATTGVMATTDVLDWDDYSSWGEFKWGELSELPVSEAREELLHFRGEVWGKRALQWLVHNNIPPVILVEGAAGRIIGDGRGRMNLAMAFAIPETKVVILKERRNGALCFEFDQYGIKR